MKGIYKISTQEGKLYIGSTTNLELRKINHLRDLKEGIHCNCYLQDIYNRLGEEGLTFSMLEETEDLSNRENFWIKATDPTILYNIDLDILNTKTIKMNARSKFKPTKSIVGLLNSKRIFGIEYIKNLTMRTKIPHKVFVSTLLKLVESGHYTKENELYIRLK